MFKLINLAEGLKGKSYERNSLNIRKLVVGVMSRLLVLYGVLNLA